MNHEPCSIVIQRDRRDDGPETQTIVPTGDTIHSHQKTHVHHVCIICLGLNRRQLRCIIIDDAVVVHNIRASASALLPGERGAGEGAGSTFFWCHECHMEYTSEKVVCVGSGGKEPR